MQTAMAAAMRFSTGLTCQKLAKMLDPVSMRDKVWLPGKIVGLDVGRW